MLATSAAVESERAGHYQMVYQVDALHWTAEVWTDLETFKASRENASLRPLASCEHAHLSDLAAISCAAKMRRKLECEAEVKEHRRRDGAEEIARRMP